MFTFQYYFKDKLGKLKMNFLMSGEHRYITIE